MMKGKKAIAPLILIVAIIGFLLVVYFILYLPPFEKVRNVVNYFAVLTFFFTIQGLLIYGYYKLGSIFFKSFTTYKKKLMNFNDKIRHMIEN